MTRRAIIADIHGNAVALKAVLADGQSRNLDEWVCLGDICGYGPDPTECVDLVRKNCTWSLCGNHDAALFMAQPIGMNRDARAAILWQKSLLQPGLFSMPAKSKRWNWLQDLPPSRTEGNIQYVHASPREPLMEYVGESDLADLGFGPSRKIVEIFERIDRLCYCGHSHWPGIATEDYQWVKPEELPNQTLKLPERQKLLINVGSVGQPRDRNPDACYVIHDTDSNEVQFVRVKYDISTAQKRFEGITELAERLSTRLATGT